jgi:hypothetical protein
MSNLFSLKAFVDASAVSSDIAEIASHFTSIPQGLAKLSIDLYTAVIHRDVDALGTLKSDAETLFTNTSADLSSASGAIAKFRSHMSDLITDLTS